MYELRILSGLHRGAALPLDDRPHLIGASEEADVVLVDSCMRQRHAILSRTDSGWLLSTEEGELFNAETNRPQTRIDLAPGAFARIGDVWMCMCADNAPWSDPPPVPDDDDFYPVDEEHPVEAAEDAASAEEEHDAAPVAVMPARRGWRPVIMIPVVGMVALSAAAYALVPKHPEQDAGKAAMAAATASMFGSAAAKVDAKEASSTEEAKAAGGHAASASAHMTRAELREAFRKKLADADLLKRFDLDLGDDAWIMRADLDDEETTRFERILKTFLTQYRVDFPVNAKVVGPEGMLPFKINQVITGANAGIVTREGERIHVGEEYRGVRLVAVQGNHLVFAGKRKIEMTW